VSPHLRSDGPGEPVCDFCTTCGAAAQPAPSPTAYPGTPSAISEEAKQLLAALEERHRPNAGVRTAIPAVCGLARQRGSVALARACAQQCARCEISADGVRAALLARPRRCRPGVLP